MITLIGFHTDWEIKVYGVFSEGTLRYPELYLSKGVLNTELLKERLTVRDKLDPFHYSSLYLIVRRETDTHIELLRVNTDLEVRVTYSLKEDSETPKLIEAKGNISSLISIEKDRLDLNQRVFTSIKELLRPPTLILYEGNTLVFKDGRYTTY